MAHAVSHTSSVLRKYQTELADDWMAEVRAFGGSTAGRAGDGELRAHVGEFLSHLAGCSQGGGGNIDQAEWAPVRESLDDIARGRAALGFSADQTAMLILSFKKAVFVRLRAELAQDAVALAEETWRVDALVDQLGLYTVRSFQRDREQVVRRQQQEMLELSTPVIQLWDGILALPLIGTLDSARTQVAMEVLLQRIVETGAVTAIIDITGVPVVDTLVAQHLLRTITAARLMGVDCIISGIRPQIAQTIVHLGVDLQGVTTKGSLADALALAFRRSGITVQNARG